MSLRDYLFYEEPGIKLFCGDCREVLPLLGRADLLLTDPPYGHGDLWQGGSWGANPIYAEAMNGWDRAPVGMDLLNQVMFHGRQSVVWGGNYYSLPPTRGWLAWIKSSPLPTLADFELAWTSADRPARAWREDRNPDGKREHPTQKPLSLFTWCLELFPGDSVIDPFCGSGTTLEASKRLGRRGIGIEIEPKYCELAVKRLRQEVLL